MPARRGWAPPSTLPTLYAGWADEFLEGPLPTETAATCEDCAMCGEGEPPGRLFFLPETKCCTYMPALPNFLVGRILADSDPAAAPGRATVEARIARRMGVTPLGLASPAVHATLYQIGGAAAFGRSTSLRCPHYLADQGGRCGIWRHRNGTCSTWFCKHGRGGTGRRFWQTLDELFASVERVLARWCVLELDLDPVALARLVPYGTDRGHGEGLDGARIDGRVDVATYAALWGRWAGRESDWFRASATLVGGLVWTDVLRIGGADVRLFARLVREAHVALGKTALPRRLAAATVEVMPAGRDRVRVVGYSGLDPLELPRAVLEVLPYFDGSPTEATLARIIEETGIRVERALVRRLVDFGVLHPAD